MSKQIFRKVALERMASPEQFDQLVRVTNSRAWIALLSVLCLVAAATAWALSGTITATVGGQGILLPVGPRVGEKIEAVLYLPLGDGKKVAPGMEAQVTPVTAKKEEHGYMLGRVVGVAEFVCSDEELLRVLKNETLVRALTGGAPVLEVRVELWEDGGAPSGYKWTVAPGPPGVSAGTPCTGIVAIERIRPAGMVIPLLK